MGLGLLLGLLELVGLGLVELWEGAGLPDLVGLLELGELPLVGTTTLRVGWAPGVCLWTAGLVLPGVVDEEKDTLGDGALPGVVDEEADTLGDGLRAEEAGDWLGM